MKRIMLVFILAIMLLVNLALAESSSEQVSVLNMQNCKDLAELMNVKYPFEDDMEAFTAKYVGQVISVDGFIYDADFGSFMRDIEIQIGNYADATSVGPRFLFEGARPEDFGFEGSEFPDFIQYGKDVRIVGQIEKYDDFDECILLRPVSMEVRNPLLEGLDIEAYTALKKGSKGDSVKTLQQKLIDLCYLDGKANGTFNNATKEAVTKFQIAVKLEATGIADPATQAVLFSDKAPEASLSISCSSVAVGSNAKTVWYVDGKKFTLQGNKTKTVKTRWGTYKFDAFGHYEKIEE